MRNRLLRSVLVAAFSAVAALGALSGFAAAGKSEVRANSTWPAVVASPANSTWPVAAASPANSTWPAVVANSATDGAGS
ncbi:hypothetical protein [Streptomyces monashensis]|uniref:hypothetical protein n=1 Tax=Streptomyces monashensis TaxID=1678012 RepID=UPI000AF46C03|nr:hypothetical protein [Streptomyces monashensis]